MTHEGGGDNVVEFKACGGTSVTLTDTSSLLDGHSYVVLLKVRFEISNTHLNYFLAFARAILV